MAEAQVHVVGAGPAGAATAIRLRRRGVTVTLTAPLGGGAPRGGESLPPAMARLLAELEVLDDFLKGDHLPSYGNESAWGSGVLRMRSFMLDRHGHGWHIDRAAFDSMLLAAAARAGARIVRKAPRASGSALTVDATGRRAVIARQRGAARIQTDPMIAIVGILESSGASTSPSTSLVESAEWGYWYAAPLPSDRMFCAFVTDAQTWRGVRANAVNAWHVRREATHHVSARTAGYVAIDRPFVVPACTSRLDKLHGPGWLAVGDAAACRDPLSSGGIFEAIRSGIRAADAIADQLKGEPGAIAAYACDLETRFSRDLQRRREVYARETRFLDSAFWTRRSHAAPTPFRSQPTHEKEARPCP